MAGFWVDGVEYELLTLDALDSFTFGDLDLLETEGGMSLMSLATGDVEITTRLMLALLVLSMRQKNPEAQMADARKVSLSVMKDLVGLIVNKQPDPAASEGDGEAVPPTTPAEASGPQQ